MSSNDHSPNSHGQQLIAHFTALIAHAKSIVSPPLRRGLLAPPDISHRRKFFQLTHRISYPLLVNFDLNRTWPTVIWFFFFLTSFLWLALAGAVLDQIYGPEATPSASSPTPNFFQYFLLGIMVALIFGFILPAYLGWIEFILDKRYPKLARLFLIIAFMGITYAFPIWPLTPFEQTWSGIITAPFQTSFPFYFCYLLFIFPAQSFLFKAFLELILLALGLLDFSTRYVFINAHNPLPQESITKLAFSKTPLPDQTQTICLSELEVPEINTLKTWSHANREATEKRLIPTTILFAFLGIFANSNLVSAGIDNFLNWFSGAIMLLNVSETTTQWDLMATYIAMSAIGAVVFGYLLLLTNLAKNIIIQNLIIEACIVAQYSQEQTQKETSKFSPPPSSHPWLNWIRRIFP